MCLNQVDHVFKPGRSCCLNHPCFLSKLGGPKNTIKQGKMKVDHWFEPDLVVVVVGLVALYDLPGGTL